MKIKILSYSLTGNNEALANRLAKELRAEHMIIAEDRKRTNGTIAADIILGRVPLTKPSTESISSCDLIILIGPVWMGQPAFPFRQYLKFIKKHTVRYVYVSVSGGALNDNPGLADVLKKKTGLEPVVVIDHHIADLLPKKQNKTRQETSTYKLTDEDIDKLALLTLSILKEKLPKEVFIS